MKPPVIPCPCVRCACGACMLCIWQGSPLPPPRNSACPQAGGAPATPPRARGRAAAAPAHSRWRAPTTRALACCLPGAALRSARRPHLHRLARLACRLLLRVRRVRTLCACPAWRRAVRCAAGPFPPHPEVAQRVRTAAAKLQSAATAVAPPQCCETASHSHSVVILWSALVRNPSAALPVACVPASGGPGWHAHGTGRRRQQGAGHRG